MDKIEAIDTFDKAVKKLGEEHPYVLQWRMFEESLIGSSMPDVEAYMKLRVIIAAIKGDWKPTRGFEGEEELWMPVFNIYPVKGTIGNPDRERTIVFPSGESADYVDAINVTDKGIANQFERFVFPNSQQADNFGSDFQRLLAQFLIG